MIPNSRRSLKVLPKCYSAGTDPKASEVADNGMVKIFDSASKAANGLETISDSQLIHRMNGVQPHRIVEDF